jgi:haloalkane dehalogenase
VDWRRTPEERFAGLADYPFAPNYATVGAGLAMHYVDEGPPDGEPILLLHGQPTWSYLYRHVIAALSLSGLRVVAPDLIGFGKSDKPVRRTDYSVRTHVRWLEEFFEATDLTGITLVVQDWGGPIGLGALARGSERFARVVAVNTALHTADAALAGTLAWACHQSEDGVSMVIEPALLDYQRMTQELAELRPSLFVQGATTTDVLDDALAGYDAPFPDESFCAGARQFPLLMGLTPASECARFNRRTLGELAHFTKPFLTAFSDGDPSTRGWERVLQQIVPGAAGHDHQTIIGAGHFAPEDRPAVLAEIIIRFVAGTPAPPAP